MARLGQVRELGTVLFVDIVDSTRVLAQLGDERWAEVLDRFEAASLDVVDRHGGRVVKTTGDGSLSLLPGPTAAIDCAGSLHAAAAELGLHLRAGAHVGELQRREDDVSGMAVHVAARLLGLAGKGETVVSEMITLMAADAGFVFEPRGRERLKGVSEPVAVFAVAPPVPSRFDPILLEVTDEDEEIETLLAARGAAGFLDVDEELVRRIEGALARTPEGALIALARLEAKLAFELRGDPSALERRRTLLHAAAAHAEASGDQAALLAALFARQHALWDPAGVDDRLDAAERAIAVARAAGRRDDELEARLARVHALIEVGRLADAEVELATYSRLAAPLDRADLRVFVSSRRCLVATIRGRFDEATRHAAEASQAAIEAAMPDADRLTLALYAPIERLRGDFHRFEAGIAFLTELSATLPGHHFEATLAGLLLDLGRRDEAQVELARALPSLLTATGHRWLSATCEAAQVAVAVGSEDDCQRLYDVLLPHADRFATLGPAFFGAVRQYLGPLAARVGRLDEAVALLEKAVDDLDAMAALPYAARARTSLVEVLDASGDRERAEQVAAAALKVATALGLAPLVAALSSRSTATEFGTQWSLRRDGDDWLIVAGAERARFRGARGFEHLRVLVANPRHDIPAADLEAGVPSLVPTAAHRPANLDDDAIAAYRQRLTQLDAQLDATDRAGDTARAAALEDERESLIAELKRGVAFGSRPRRSADASERARVNVTRAIKRSLDQISRAAPRAGAHLTASIRTGTMCRYEPVGGGPDHWEP